MLLQLYAMWSFLVLWWWEIWLNFHINPVKYGLEFWRMFGQENKTLGQSTELFVNIFAEFTCSLIHSRHYTYMSYSTDWRANTFKVIQAPKCQQKQTPGLLVPYTRELSKYKQAEGLHTVKDTALKDLVWNKKLIQEWNRRDVTLR